MSEVLKKVFGKSISEEPFSFPKGTPAYIAYGYQPCKFSYFEKSFLVVAPKTENYNIGTVKKHIAVMEQLCNLPCVINLPRLTARQRENLIENCVSFISGNNQLFLPFLGCYLEKRIGLKAEAPATMSFTAQMIFLHIFYAAHEKAEGITQTQIAKQLQISKATCTRAIKQLTALRLISAQPSGTAKRITLNGSPKETLKRAIPFMVSPVSKTIYVQSIPENLIFRSSGIKALSEISMIAAKDSDPGLAISEQDSKSFAAESIIPYQDFIDFGGYAVEIWKYNPAVLTRTSRVDDLSLLMELNESKDERIQNCLDVIRRRYGIEVEEW